MSGKPRALPNSRCANPPQPGCHAPYTIIFQRFGGHKNTRYTGRTLTIPNLAFRRTFPIRPCHVVILSLQTTDGKIYLLPHDGLKSKAGCRDCLFSGKQISAYRYEEPLSLPLYLVINSMYLIISMLGLSDDLSLQGTIPATPLFPGSCADHAHTVGITINYPDHPHCQLIPLPQLVKANPRSSRRS